MSLKLEVLENREVPTLFTGVGYVEGYQPIPGWTGEVDVVNYGNHDVFTAGEGGSVRVRAVHYQTGEVAIDEIVFDPNFRGGGRTSIVNGDLIVAPGVGGGPVIAVIKLNGPQSFTVTNHILPYDQAFRGGIYIQSSDVNNDGKNELLCLPGEGGGPVFKAIDVDSGEVVLDFLVGPEEDRSGYKFVEAGVGVQLRSFTPGMSYEDYVGMYLQIAEDELTTFGVTFSGIRV